MKRGNRLFSEEIFEKLNKEGVKYVIVGGVALVLHGVVRLTADLDLMLEMSEENLKRFISCMKALGYKPKAPVKAEDFINHANRKKWKEEKGMMVFSFYSLKRPWQLLDVFVDEPISFREVEKEIVWFRAKELKLPVISIRHLKILKKMAARPQDLADIEALEELEKLRENENKGN
ncbi:hypothetical protein DRP98_10060 [candidate division KSB1 bacterium]|nr:MAG: hypothetical protein DRP98_10060 [candidate division KSB1 bacterium]